MQKNAERVPSSLKGNFRKPQPNRHTRSFFQFSLAYLSGWTNHSSSAPRSLPWLCKMQGHNYQRPESEGLIRKLSQPRSTRRSQSISRRTIKQKPPDHRGISTHHGCSCPCRDSREPEKTQKLVLGTARGLMKIIRHLQRFQTTKKSFRVFCFLIFGS